MSTRKMFSLTSTVTLFILLQLNLIIVQAKPNYVRNEMPVECQGKNYCTRQADDYPKEQIEKILSGLHLRAVDEVGNRNGEGDMDPVCESVPVVDPVYQIVDERGDVRYVAQQLNEENPFVQKLYIVECKNPGRITSPAGPFQDYQLQEYNVSCVETRLEHKFLVLSHDMQHLELASAAGGMPVCCSCRYSDLNTAK